MSEEIKSDQPVPQEPNQQVTPAALLVIEQMLNPNNPDDMRIGCKVQYHGKPGEVVDVMSNAGAFVAAWIEANFDVILMMSRREFQLRAQHAEAQRKNESAKVGLVRADGTPLQ